MINNFAILVSVGSVAYVLYRAIMLDRLMPWFDRPAPPAVKRKPR